MNDKVEQSIRNCKREEDKAKQVIKLLNYKNYPIPTVKTCSFFGFKIYQDELPKNKHGYIIIDKKLRKEFNTDRIIVVNVKDSTSRRRFSVAHELGHYFINFSPKDNQPFFYAFEMANNSKDANEKKADKFAASLLMPEEIIRKKYKELLGKKLNYFEIIEELSHIFVVPKESVEKRIREELEIING